VASRRFPARGLPLLYLGTAHVSLALAFLLAACWPWAVAGFFYHAWLVGLVHLVTIGWISFSILGAFFIVAPLALRADMPVRRADYVAFAFAIVGLVGMVGHFWIQQFSGMAWSAATVACGILYMSVRIAGGIRRAAVHPAVRAHIVLACVNLWLAASMGLLLAFDKFLHFLPGFVLTNVFAHAHLAALGWAAMMVMGIAYRMLPMLLPSKLPSGCTLFASAAALESGVLGLFVTLLMRSRLAAGFGALIVSAMIMFAGHIVWMRRRLVSKPVDAPRVDFGILHAANAGFWLVVAAALGLSLLVLPPSPVTLRLAAAYGVAGLIGFLAQIVVAMESRLLPLAAWYWTYRRGGFAVAPPSPHVMRDRALQAITFAGWTLGVPALAGGVCIESGRLVGAGAWLLFASVAIAALDNAFVVGRSFSARHRDLPSVSCRPSPRSASDQAARATKTKIRGTASSAGTSIACARRNVQTVYMPRGKTAPQYNGS
jgi:hypothetical protein